MLNFINRLARRESAQGGVDPIIIYQHGKVGCSTILASVNHAFHSVKAEAPVYHGHHLNNLEQMEADIKSNPPTHRNH